MWEYSYRSKVKKMTKPRSPADPRPNGRPYYIEDVCVICDTKLSPYEEGIRNGWYDEFVCDCPGVHLDVPDSVIKDSKGEWDRAKSTEFEALRERE